MKMTSKFKKTTKLPDIFQTRTQNRPKKLDMPRFIAKQNEVKCTNYYTVTEKSSHSGQIAIEFKNFPITPESPQG